MSLGTYTALEWVPKVTYDNCGTPVVFTLALPQMAWRYSSKDLGGHDVAASGVGESFVIRHDRVLTLTWRFTEEEWVETVEPFFQTVHAQAQAFTIQADQSDVATAKLVRLVRPQTGDSIEPRPNPYDGVLDLEFVVRTDDGSAFPYPYFPSLK